MSALAGFEIAGGVLACLPEMTARRLRIAFDVWGGPEPALDAIRRGRGRAVLVGGAWAADTAAHDAVARRWREAATSARLPALLERRATRVYVDGRGAYPITDAIPDRPPVLLAEGDRPEVWAGPRVAVVGTRAATPHGLADAYDLGASLAASGVTVVSGLAIGIDGAAHEGALDHAGAVVGVVATGLDVVYPRRHGVLFERVRHAGLLVSELAYGMRPRRELFPVRNRIIASLADVVVVVEATARGGARITANYAIDYGRQVFAMPGSRRNPSAVGTNELIRDGASPFLDASDVLVALGLTPGCRRASRTPPENGAPGAVLRACGGDAATLDQLVSRTGLAPADVAAALRELERADWIERAEGLWWPRS